MESAEGSQRIQVAVRARPLNSLETTKKSEQCLSFDGCTLTITEPSKPAEEKNSAANSKSRAVHRYTYDALFDSTSVQEDGADEDQSKVYDTVGKGILDNAFSGFNGCLFAYGQTGSGKTYTMQGTPSAPGVIPRLCGDLFRRIEAPSEAADGDAGPVEVTVEVSYLEIYNEKVMCLLAPKKDALRVREHPATGPYVDGLTKLRVTSYVDIEKAVDRGMATRHVAATAMNATSSRSHAILSLVITQRKEVSVGGKNVATETAAKINLVDLAGSERVSKTGASGDRLREGADINKSLTVLGLVISALATGADADSKGKAAGRGRGRGAASHIPYRDSTLTWLLKENLGGNSKTTMVAAVSPAAFNYDETLSTARYADRAKSIVTSAVVNEDANAKLIRELRAEIATLRAQLQSGAQAAPVKPPSGVNGASAEGADAVQSEVAAAKAAAEAATAEAERLRAALEAAQQAAQKDGGGAAAVSQGEGGEEAVASEAAVAERDALRHKLEDAERALRETKRAPITEVVGGGDSVGLLLELLPQQQAPPPAEEGSGSTLLRVSQGEGGLQVCEVGEGASPASAEAQEPVEDSTVGTACYVRVHSLVARGATRIGSLSGGVDVLVSGDDVAPLHAFVVAGGKAASATYELVCVGGNGAKVNGEAVGMHPRRLGQLDRVSVGASRLVLLLPGPLEPAQMPSGCGGEVLSRLAADEDSAVGDGKVRLRVGAVAMGVGWSVADAEASGPAVRAPPSNVSAKDEAAHDDVNDWQYDVSVADAGASGGKEEAKGDELLDATPAPAGNSGVIVEQGKPADAQSAVDSRLEEMMRKMAEQEALLAQQREALAAREKAVAAASVPAPASQRHSVPPPRYGDEQLGSASVVPLPAVAVQPGEHVVSAMKWTLVFVGHQEVGKTSLRHCLLREPTLFERKALPKVSSTVGVEMVEHRMTVKRAIGEAIVDLLLLDVAGQKCYPTHSFFLPRSRATFLYVWKMSEPPDEALMRSWLTAIGSHYPAAKLVLVGTHRDDCRDSSERAIRATLVATARLFEENARATQPADGSRVQIVGNFAVSCKARTVLTELPRGKQINKFRNLLGWFAEEAANDAERDLVYPQGLVPRRTAVLTNDLMALRRRNVWHLPFSQLRQMALHCDASRFSDPTALQAAVQLLVSWHSIMRFAANPALRDHVFTNPPFVSAILNAVFSFIHYRVWGGRGFDTDFATLGYDLKAVEATDVGDNVARGLLPLSVAKLLLARVLRIVAAHPPSEVDGASPSPSPNSGDGALAVAVDMMHRFDLIVRIDDDFLPTDQLCEDSSLWDAVDDSDGSQVTSFIPSGSDVGPGIGAALYVSDDVAADLEATAPAAGDTHGFEVIDDVDQTYVYGAQQPLPSVPTVEQNRAPVSIIDRTVGKLSGILPVGGGGLGPSPDGPAVVAPTNPFSCGAASSSITYRNEGPPLRLVAVTASAYEPIIRVLGKAPPLECSACQFGGDEKKLLAVREASPSLQRRAQNICPPADLQAGPFGGDTSLLCRRKGMLDTYYAIPSLFQGALPALIERFVPTLLGGSHRKYSLSLMPDGFFGRLVCRVGALVQRLYFGPIGSLRHGAPPSSPVRKLWATGVWVQDPTFRALLRVSRRSIYVHTSICDENPAAPVSLFLSAVDNAVRSLCSEFPGVVLNVSVQCPLSPYVLDSSSPTGVQPVAEDDNPVCDQWFVLGNDIPANVFSSFFGAEEGNLDVESVPCKMCLKQVPLRNVLLGRLHGADPSSAQAYRVGVVQSWLRGCGAEFPEGVAESLSKLLGSTDASHATVCYGHEGAVLDAVLDLLSAVH